MERILVFFISFFLAGLVGCAARPSAMMTSTSPLPPGVRGTIPTTASNCQYRFLGIIPVTGSESSAEALMEAKLDAEVDVLTDVTLDNSVGYYILFSNSCVRVSGLGVPRGSY